MIYRKGRRTIYTPTSPERTNALRVFTALSSPLRLELILLLQIREHTVSELAATTGKSQPLVSQHLKVLKDAGVVDFHKEGRKSNYRLADERIVTLVRDAADLEIPEKTVEAETPVG